MATNHTVNVTIGGVLKSTFANAMGQGRSQTLRLGDAIRKMETDSQRLSSFQKLSGDVKKASLRFSEAEEKVRQLKNEIRNADQPTKQMQVNLGRAQAAANKAKNALASKRMELVKVSHEMKKSGQSTRNLVGQQERLGASITKLNAKYKSLDNTLRKRDAILAKRGALRGQIFETLALGAAIGAPIKAAIDFESAMADVRKVVDFADPLNGLKKFGDLIKKMSRDIPISAQGLAQIAAEGGTLGIGENDLPQFVDIVAKMATAFDLMPAEAGESIAKLSNIFGIPINEMTKLGDAINHLSDNTAAKARDIIPVISRVGAQAKDFGLSAEQTSALADSFIALGKPPQIAATAINAMLLRLNNANKQSAKFQRGLSELGLEATALQGAIKDDAQGALLSFLETVSKVEKQQRAGILSDLFGLEFADDVSLLAGSVDQYKKALTLLGQEKKHNSMQREFENRANTTANKLQLLTNDVIEVGISIGNTLLPALNAVIKPVRVFAQGLSNFTISAPLISKVIFGTAFALIGLKIAALGLSFAWSFIIGGAVLVKAALMKIGIEATLTGIRFKSLNLVTLITSARMKALTFASVLAGIWTKLGLTVSLVRARLVAFNIMAGITFLRIKSLAIGQVLASVFGILGGAVSLAGAKMLAFNAISLVTAGTLKALAFGGMIKTFAVGLLSLATSVIPVIVGGLKILTVAFMTNPIGLIIGGIALAAGLLIAKWDAVKNFFSGIWEPVQAVWQNFAGWLGGFWKLISAPITAIGKIFGLLFGSNKEIQASITSNETPNNNSAGNIENLAPVKSRIPQDALPIKAFDNQRTIDSRTITNNFNIEVNAAQGQDAETIAAKVMRQIKDASRGALFDTAGATL